MGNKFVVLLICEYIIITIAYIFQKDWARVAYFIGATILSLGVLWMK